MTALERSVSDTAYLVCESRARRVELSRDVHARGWIAPDQREAVADLWQEFGREVYPHDALEVSLRNRYWLERIEAFVGAAEDPVFVNVGAGLTSYPFLLETPVAAVELDRPSLVRYKGARMRELRGEEALPQRNVDLHAADLDSEVGLGRLEEVLRRACASRDSFVLCEGLVYYLRRPSVHALVDACRRAQREGSILAIDFWPPGAADAPAFRRMERFFETRLGMDGVEYTFLDEGRMRSVEGYETVGLTDVVRQEREIAGTRHLEDPENVLPESYATLRRS